MKVEVQEADTESILAKILVLDSEIGLQEEVLAEDRHKKQQFKLDNERRKHNYIPLILELLSLASERGNLKEQYEKAKSTMTQTQAPAAPK